MRSKLFLAAPFLVAFLGLSALHWQVSRFDATVSASLDTAASLDEILSALEDASAEERQALEALNADLQSLETTLDSIEGDLTDWTRGGLAGE